MTSLGMEPDQQSYYEACKTFCMQEIGNELVMYVVSEIMRVQSDFESSLE